MIAPRAAVRIQAVAAVYPSESPTKVEAAIHNIFDGETRHEKFSIYASATDPKSLEIVKEAIGTGSKSNKAYKRILHENLHNGTTWFYLNKQAAYAGSVAICNEADESPLGPIKITISSADVAGFIDWLLLL